MVVNIEYVDKDYGDKIESDKITIGLKDEDFDKFVEDFYIFANYYMNGYELGEILYEEDWEEVLNEVYPGLSREDAEYFANERENGLDGSMVVTSFLEKYPQYNCEFNGSKVAYIEFSDYDMIINGVEYSQKEDEDLER